MHNVRSSVASLVILLCLACYGTQSQYQGPQPEDQPTILLRNPGPYPQRIYVDYGGLPMWLGELRPGMTLCARLPMRAGSYRLLARAPGGHVTTSLPFTPDLHRTWEWTVTMGGASDLLSLAPAGEGCLT